MDLNLRGHVAVVTGGASGIGRAIADAFAAEGASVALWDMNPKTAPAADEIAKQHGAKVLGLVVDVTDEANVRHAAAETSAKLGPIDHLVHAAAIGSGKFGFPFTNLEPADWRSTLEVNIMGMVHVAHAVAPAMIEPPSRYDDLHCLGRRPDGFADRPALQRASKAANINFSQVLAKDLASAGVRVNTVCPGMVQTPLNQSVWQAWNDQQPPDRRRSYEDWAGDKVQQIVPLGRWQEPRDIADMVVFLSSDRAAQVTGQTINVDGGYVMHW